MDAPAFVKVLSDRLANRVQLTTDGNWVYLEAIEAVLDGEIDYAMLIKLYDPEPSEERRYGRPSAPGPRSGSSRVVPTRPTSPPATSRARTSPCAWAPA